ncbi:hybrid signal transduction histidine kinase M [Tanacetum coccineum]
MDTKKVEGSKAKAAGSETRVEESSKRAGEELDRESTKKQKVEDETEQAELKECFEIIPFDEDAVNTIPLATKQAPIVDYKITRDARKIYYHITRADGSTKVYMRFEDMLKMRQKQVLKTENPGKRIAFLENEHSKSFAKCLRKEVERELAISKRKCIRNIIFVNLDSSSDNNNSDSYSTSQISTSEEIDYDSPEPPKSLLKWYHYLSDEYKDNGRFWGSKLGCNESDVKLSWKDIEKAKACMLAKAQASEASSKAKVEACGSKVQVEACGSKAKLQASTKTLIVKSPVPITNCILGLANAKTWDAIKGKTFGVLHIAFAACICTLHLQLAFASKHLHIAFADCICTLHLYIAFAACICKQAFAHCICRLKCRWLEAMNEVQNPGIQNVGNQNGLIIVPRIANQNPNRNGNVIEARAEGNAIENNGNQIRCYNCRGLGHLARNCTIKPRRRDAAYLQTQLLIAQKEEAGIQLQAEEFNLMVATADLDKIKEVNANYILMANLQRASTLGTQTYKAPVYDSDGSAEVHNYNDCYDNEIFNMFTQEEQNTELLEPIPEPHQVQL